jgi:folate-binding protein YgfZ
VSVRDSIVRDSLVRDSIVVVDRSDRGLVTVAGPDALSFLQSLVSQDVTGLAVGAGAHTLLLTPQGKLDIDARVVRAGDDELWLDTEPDFGPRLAESLQRFRIRVKAEIVDAGAAFGSLAVRGPGAAHLRAHVEGPAVVVDVPWPFGDAFDVIGPSETVDALHRTLLGAGAVACGHDEFEDLRIEAGIPRQGADLDERTIPQEAFLELDAVSFTKGCFLGQELVCRIDTRGHVNRFLRSVHVLDGSRPPVGAEVLVDDKAVGALTSVTSTGDLPSVALGFVRRQVEPPIDVVLRWDGGEAHARVEATPASAAAISAS